MPEDLPTKKKQPARERKREELTFTDQRMLQLIDILKESKRIRFTNDFLRRTETPKQNIWNIKKGKQHFSFDQIRAAVEKFGVNANWIFGVEEEVFRAQ